MKKFVYLHYKNEKLKDVDDKNTTRLFFDKHKTPSCHLMGKEFSSQLMKVKANVLSSYFFDLKNDLYIEFAENIKFKNDFVSGCIYIPSLPETPSFVGDTQGARTCSLSLFSTHNDYVSTLNFYFDESVKGMTIDEFLNSRLVVDHQVSDLIPDYQNLQASETVDIVRYAINCILYIESGSPDLRTIHPPKNNTKSKKGLKKFQREFPIDMPIIYVGFNYKKHNFYTSDGCHVSGHFRWQPYGTGRALIKLVWIEEYDKHFNQAII